ncbi:MAG: hypothetical protein CENE_02216 [Candidatus Celerinatantimonas neptuna]|nr:MAG: hypothetical protein CENE_02216 [Candidatus Celerinatantimonas neptuna]
MGYLDGKVIIRLFGVAFLWGIISLPVFCAEKTAVPAMKVTPIENSASKKNTTTEVTHTNLHPVQIYTQDELIGWINKNEHLARVKADDCQLVQDIKVRAEKIDIPAYQFLWGDMLAWGVCVPKDAELGVHFMWQAAHQGLPAALEQLGRYYYKGILVQKNQQRAIQLLRESASLGFVKARIEYVQMLAKGYGSPYDYQQAYQWLQNSIIGDKQQHQKAQILLASLAKRMPPDVVAKAKATRPGY